MSRMCRGECIGQAPAFHSDRSRNVRPAHRPVDSRRGPKADPQNAGQEWDADLSLEWTSLSDSGELAVWTVRAAY